MLNALRLGATAEEIMEVLMLTSVLGVHTITESVPILVEEVAKAGKAAARAQRAAAPRTAAAKITAPRKRK